MLSFYDLKLMNKIWSSELEETWKTPLPLVNHRHLYIYHSVRGRAALQDRLLKVVFLFVKLLSKKNNNENHQLVQKEAEKSNLFMTP